MLWPMGHAQVMRQLGISEGGVCSVATAAFPKAQFAKFQPHKSEFLDVTDHYVRMRMHHGPSIHRDHGPC